MKKQAGVKLRSWRCRISAGAILLTVLVICGCGSDSKQDSKETPDKSKVVIDKERSPLKILEVPQGKEPLTDKAVQEEGKTSKLPDTVDMDEIIFPPSKPGEKGVTRREVEELRKKHTPADPLDQEMFPPPKPGEKGMTGREVELLRKQQAPVDPLNQEAFQPGKSGEKGLTVKEVEELRKQQPQVDPLDQEMFPGDKPGERGMTLRDVERLRALESKTQQKDAEPFSPEPSR